jgi:lysophospholipase L1-like esterase
MAPPAGQAAAMKTIMCYGDSNTWGCIPLTGPRPARRYGPARRVPGVLRRELGDGYWIVIVLASDLISGSALSPPP